MATFMKTVTLFFPLLSSLHLCAGEKLQSVYSSFYNLENLYDTMNNPLVNDEDFTPLGTSIIPVIFIRTN